MESDNGGVVFLWRESGSFGQKIVATHGCYLLIQVRLSREMQNPISPNSLVNEVWVKKILPVLLCSKLHFMSTYFVHLSQILTHFYFIVVAYNVTLMRGRTTVIFNNKWKYFWFDVSWDMSFCWCHYGSSSL